MQRVKSASVTVDGELISQIGKGLLVLAAISKDDTEKDIESMAGKVLKAKLWDDDTKDPPSRVSSRSANSMAQVLTRQSGSEGWRKWAERSFAVHHFLESRGDDTADHLVVSQFTLLATTKKANKLDFHQSASGIKARTLYRAFFKKVQELYEPDKVKDGVFAAMMDVALVNDGPVGIDYTCLDGEVYTASLSVMTL